MKIKKGDTVLIMAGKDRGKKGKIIQSFPKENAVLVEGANLKKKHAKAKRQGESGQIVQIPAPISVSNVLAICPKCGKPSRLGYKIEGKNKYRYCKKCKKEL
ncbi:MAG: 50S ribosomal protein L24 [Candidatus Nealsonbacteria bacterium RIFOXYB1_FULL_40_15]|uniref:Large ribosomal subunit protein uL24 n=2 Tax=Candidatus Nealsoniibacteriota TaxID=1817911 RepID=A0A1G2ELJ8_9BACT|nr:MAG: 50S ribosomal protein L24 [Candidatus Nealsonbacteria bacterium RIFOXYC1_FULL_40_7]OGZ27812.1 MAG: 50S ribosomal protein L24 [Candidatus Nealsonbacteria bacterium RIFOXYB1_FULL_40_15]OGZ28936.1 MAG: 50S ribosomal protein L24 [Candidatus Nealsonbacteria bacterium RIFOXYD1_FULL_39_11]